MTYDGIWIRIKLLLKTTAIHAECTFSFGISLTKKFVLITPLNSLSFYVLFIINRHAMKF